MPEDVPAPLPAIGFLVVLLAIPAGIGLWFDPFFQNSAPLRHWSGRLVVGLAVSVIVNMVGYVSGVSINTLFGVLSVAAIAAWIRLLLRAWRDRAALPRLSPAIVGLVLLVGAIHLTPYLRGGKQFAIFQGNLHDTYTYLESAFTYARIDADDVRRMDDATLVRAGGFPMARLLLDARPANALYYATISRADPARFLTNHHLLLLAFSIVATITLAYLLQTLVSALSTAVSLAVALLLQMGFWGQYPIDIDAWCQVGWTPMIFFAVAECLNLQRSGTPPVDWLRPRHLTPCFIAMLGAYTYYPEGTITFSVCFVALLLVLLRGDVTTCWNRWLGCWLAVLVGFLFLTREQNVIYLTNQYQQATTELDWWEHFHRFLAGRDGITPRWWDASDFGAGVLGAYFITPGPSTPTPIAGLLHGAIWLWLGGVLVATLRAYTTPTADRVARQREQALLGFVAAGSLVIIAFLWRGNLWTAGKALSFIAPFLSVIVLVPVLHRIGGDLRQLLNPRAWPGIALLLICAFTIGLRGLKSARYSGVLYSWPYPSASMGLKHEFRFDDSTYLQAIQADDVVLVDIDEVWLREFAMIELALHDIRVEFDHPFPASRWSTSKLVDIPPTASPTVRLTVEPGTGPERRLHARRLD